MASPSLEDVDVELAVVLPRAPAFSRAQLSALYELGKPNLSLLVVLTGLLGYFLAAPSFAIGTAALLLTGLYMTSAGAAGMNMVVEEDSDAKMRRTRGRPVPSGRLGANQALLFSIGLFFLGFIVLFIGVNPLTAGLSHLTGAIYVLVYTPLKRRGPIATWVGAIPGAIPPMMGWTAARGQIDAPALVLFGVLYLWQFPHFLALAWMYREDYRRGGFDFLTRRDDSGTATSHLMLVMALALLGTSLLLVPLGQASWLYGVGALLCGLHFLRATVRVAIERSTQYARGVFFASIAYLPILLVLIVLDRLLLG